jgi:hypothetical protein
MDEFNRSYIIYHKFHHSLKFIEGILKRSSTKIFHKQATTTIYIYIAMTVSKSSLIVALGRTIPDSRRKTTLILIEIKDLRRETC